MRSMILTEPLSRARDLNSSSSPARTARSTELPLDDLQPFLRSPPRRCWRSSGRAGTRRRRSAPGTGPRTGAPGPCGRCSRRRPVRQGYQWHPCPWCVLIRPRWSVACEHSAIRREQDDDRRDPLVTIILNKERCRSLCTHMPGRRNRRRGISSPGADVQAQVWRSPFDPHPAAQPGPSHSSNGGRRPTGPLLRDRQFHCHTFLHAYPTVCVLHTVFEDMDAWRHGHTHVRTPVPGRDGRIHHRGILEHGAAPPARLRQETGQL